VTETGLRKSAAEVLATFGPPHEGYKALLGMMIVVTATGSLTPLTSKKPAPFEICVVSQ
jgi:hypothetical protein